MENVPRPRSSLTQLLRVALPALQQLAGAAVQGDVVPHPRQEVT